MEALNALGRILLASIPTFLLVWILFLYITRIFLRPLEKTLRKRYESTVALREAAEAALARAERKTSEYQEALRTARAETYHIQEQERQSALDRRAEIIRQAQRRAEEIVSRARQEIRADVEDAKQRLAVEAGDIALSITRAVLMPVTVPSQRSPNGGSPGGLEVAS